jgi:hypothetical protein
MGEKTLKKFHDLTNSIHPRIKIELKFSKNQIEFLDTITVLDNGFLTSVVGIDGFGLLSNACLHASKPSFLGTPGYKPFTSMQNKI